MFHGREKGKSSSTVLKRLFFLWRGERLFCKSTLHAFALKLVSVIRAVRRGAIGGHPMVAKVEARIQLRISNVENGFRVRKP